MRSQFKACAKICAPLFALFIVPHTAVAAPPGEAAFQQRCAMCHSMAPGPGKMGPPLNGIVGRKAGSAAGFPYSPTMKSSKIVWDRAKLDAYLKDPSAFMPGTRMVIRVPDGAVRKAIVDHLAAQRGKR